MEIVIEVQLYQLPIKEVREIIDEDKDSNSKILLLYGTYSH